MKLFLASEAKHPQTIKRLEEYVHGFKGKTIAYIPTAANGEGWGSWKDSGTWQIIQKLGGDITFVQLEDYRSKETIQFIQGKDIIWFAGGMAGYLLYWIRRRQLDTSLKHLLKNNIYVGSSAGSMIAGLSIEIANWYPNDEEHGASIFPGLGLVDFDIYPHYEESMLAIIKKNYKGNKLYLLKNGEHIIVEDKKIILQGEERLISNSLKDF